MAGGSLYTYTLNAVGDEALAQTISEQAEKIAEEEDGTPQVFFEGLKINGMWLKGCDHYEVDNHILHKIANLTEGKFVELDEEILPDLPKLSKFTVKNPQRGAFLSKIMFNHGDFYATDGVNACRVENGAGFGDETVFIDNNIIAGLKSFEPIGICFYKEDDSRYGFVCKNGIEIISLKKEEDCDFPQALTSFWSYSSSTITSSFFLPKKEFEKILKKGKAVFAKDSNIFPYIDFFEGMARMENGNISFGHEVKETFKDVSLQKRVRVHLDRAKTIYDFAKEDVVLLVLGDKMNPVHFDIPTKSKIKLLTMPLRIKE
jgi:hypothetical protein